MLTVRERVRLLNEAPQMGSFKPIEHSIVSPEVRQALADFAVKLAAEKIQWAVIGGLSVGVYARPRTTIDVDLAVLDEATIPGLAAALAPEFKQHRPHAFEHRQTGVEVEIVTPQSVRAPTDLIRSAMESAVVHQVDGAPVPVVDVRHLIALKLLRASRQDQADIESIVRSQGAVDLSGLSLTNAQTDIYDAIVKSLTDQSGPISQ